MLCLSRRGCNSVGKLAKRLRKIRRENRRAASAGCPFSNEGVFLNGCGCAGFELGQARCQQLFQLDQSA